MCKKNEVRNYKHVVSGETATATPTPDNIGGTELLVEVSTGRKFRCYPADLMSEYGLGAGWIKERRAS